MNTHLMHIIISTLVVILCLISVIGIHEYGHALAAHLFHIHIQRISLGFGKTIKRWICRSGYQIELNLWLIGGRVHLLNSRLETVENDKLNYCFDKKPIWIRTIVLIAGSLANLITAVLALCLMMMLGLKQAAPVIAHITPDSHAAIAGLQPGDRLTQVAQHSTPFWRDVGMEFIMNVGKTQVPIIACSASGRCRALSINLKLGATKTPRLSLFEMLGIIPDQSTANEIQVKSVPLGTALKHAWAQCWQLIWFFIVMIKQIFASNIPFAALLGPFKLFETIIDSFSQGITIFLYFIANFSIAMALVNLLPLPSLDGGSVIYGFIEKIRGKPISIAFELLLYRLFFIILVLIFIQLILNDLRAYQMI